MTDPKVIRAVAHPARVAIIDYLKDGPATATECSTAVEQSPSSCSYHLRTLATLGFVDEVPSDDGRERKWRLKIKGHGIPKRAQDSPEVQAAAQLWGAQWIAVAQRQLAEFLATESREPAVWRKATSFYSQESYLTPDELIELTTRFIAMLEPYAERTESENRPGGSRPVRLALTAFPRADPADRRRKAAPRQKGTRGRAH